MCNNIGKIIMRYIKTLLCLTLISCSVLFAKNVFATDYLDYSSLQDIRQSADVIVNGKVNSSEQRQDPSPGNAPDGAPLPALSRTNYEVAVNKIYKGSSLVCREPARVPVWGGFPLEVERSSGGR